MLMHSCILVCENSLPSLVPSFFWLACELVVTSHSAYWHCIPAAIKQNQSRAIRKHSRRNIIWEKYLVYQAEIIQQQLEANQQELAERERIAQEKQGKQVKLSELILSLARYVEEKNQESTHFSKLVRLLKALLK